MANVPLHPRNPERVCWGCDKYCPADDLACGNGTIRTPHPIELFGEDWLKTERRPRSAPPAPE
jgi:hypothetical protein